MQLFFFFVARARASCSDAANFNATGPKKKLARELRAPLEIPLRRGALFFFSPSLLVRKELTFESWRYGGRGAGFDFMTSRHAGLVIVNLARRKMT